MSRASWFSKVVVLAASILTLAVFASAQRLPDTAVPNHYDLKFIPDLDNDTFTGEETIDIRVRKPTNSITLNSVDLKLSDVTISVAGHQQTATVQPDTKDEMVTLTVPTQLDAGAARIHMQFSGILNNQLRGFYASESQGKKYAVSQFEATDARRAFPCFDEPAMKATFDVTLVAPKDDMAISNGPVVSDDPGPGTDQHTVKFARTVKLSSYLVALLVGDFQCVSGESDGIPIRVCAPPPSQKLGTFALDIAKFALHYYDDYFGIKYPYQKLDLIAVPDFSAGAMENAGAITFRTNLLLVDPKSASDSAKKEVAIVTTHEMAHQWFGDLVTMQWWDDVWLNEGFATWMEPKPVEAMHPEWHIMLNAESDTMRAMAADSLEATRPIHANAANTPDEIAHLFDEIAYQKAGAVLRMIESYVGPDQFRSGVREYLKAHEYGNATSADFWNAETNATKKPVNKIMKPFVEQPGVAMVSVASQCASNKTRLDLRQQRFFSDAALLDKPSPELWPIPVCMKVPGSSSDTCHVLDQRQGTVELSGCPSSVFINANAAGYYRSAYKTTEVQALEKKIDTELNPAERISLLYDEWAMARVGRSTIGDYLSLVGSVRNDRTPVVWRQVEDSLRNVNHYLTTSQDEQQFQTWVRNLVTPLAQELGWKPKAGESDDVKDLRPHVYSILGIVGDDKQVLEQADALAREYLKSTESVDPSMVGTVLRLAARNGNEDLYDIYMNAMPSPRTPQEYQNLLQALTYFPEPQLRKRTLELALSPKVRSQNTGTIVGFWQDGHPTRENWDFIRTNWKQLSSKIPPTFESGFLSFPASRLCTEQDVQQVQDFFREISMAGAQRQEKQALESIQNCVNFRKDQSSDLAKFLEQKAPSAGK